MTGISHIPCCYGSSVAMASRMKLNSSFVLSCIEVTCGVASAIYLIAMIT